MKDPKYYLKQFSEAKFTKVAIGYLKPIGYKSLYSALLLFYSYKRPETPYWAKHVVLGTLGYLIAPIDAIPDLSPILGYTDDIGVLSFGLMTIACYVNLDVKVKARQQLKAWFGEIDMEAIQDVDTKL